MEPLPILQLKQAAQAALKQWHAPNIDTSPFQELYLFQQRLVESGDVQAATNEVLHATLEALAERTEKYAQLLRLRFLDELSGQAVAHRLNVAKGTVYNQQREAIDQFVTILTQRESEARQACQSALAQRLQLSSNEQLVGAEIALNLLLERATTSDSPWLLSIEGIGGIGKTALAIALIMELALTGRYRQIAWISAKQNEFEPLFGREASDKPTLDQDALVTNLLEQLNPDLLLAGSSQERQIALAQLLKESAYFVVVDNLESVIDYQTLLPLLRKLANPSRILITSRHSLQAYTDVFCYAVPELSQANTLAFLKQEATERGLDTLTQATDDQLIAIYDVVGGNPLALKLVVGQITLLPLTRVLDNLKQAQGESIAELYTYIYWQAWHLLDADSQRLFLRMPLVHSGTLAQLEALTELSAEALNWAITQLANLSLIQIDGDLEERRYALHRLTETFLLQEAIQWQGSQENGKETE